METAWIEEKTACSASGVSASTLQRFAEAGYLKTSSRFGTLFYNPEELTQVFGIEIPTTPSSPAPEIDQKSALVEEEAADTPLDAHRESSTPSVTEEALSTVETIVATTKPPANTPESSFPELQRQKLLSAIELLEKLLQAKDNEVEDLRKQRSWLQERVQRLEEKGDRDQLLLLAESQTLRRLIEVNAPRRSLLERTLGVLGFLPAPEEPSSDAQSRKSADR